MASQEARLYIEAKQRRMAAERKLRQAADQFESLASALKETPIRIHFPKMGLPGGAPTTRAIDRFPSVDDLTPLLAEYYAAFGLEHQRMRSMSDQERDHIVNADPSTWKAFGLID